LKKKSTRKAALQAREKADAALREAAQAARVQSLEWVDRLRDDPDSITVLQQQMVADLKRVYNTPHSVLGRTAGRSRYRELGHFAETLVRLAFGTHTNFKAEAGLTETPTERKGATRAAKLHREQKVRKYYEEKIEPFAADPFVSFSRRGVISFVAHADHHSSRVDPFAMRVLLDFLKWCQPDLQVINGDAHEFSDFSTHRKFPGHFDMSAAEEVDYCADQIYRPCREAAPGSQIYWVMGNHDYRFVRYVADGAPDLMGIRGLNIIDAFRLREFDIHLVCRSNFLAPTSKMRKRDVAENWMVVNDTMVFTHGLFLGKNANERHHERFQMSGCNSHAHRASQTYFNSLSGGPAVWTTTPMMAGLAVGRDYVSLPSQWQTGFVYGTIDKRTKEVQQHIITVGDTATFAGRTWRINGKERRAREQAWSTR
jgi:hypothetical protein